MDAAAAAVLIMIPFLKTCSRIQRCVMTAHQPNGTTEQMLHRIYSEYLEMPGLRLTLEQARRLWGLDKTTCAQLLEHLVEARFLVLTELQTYARLTEGSTVFPHLRMAKRELDSRGDRAGQSHAS
jgi:hypothetical protein